MVVRYRKRQNFGKIDDVLRITNVDWTDCVAYYKMDDDVTEEVSSLDGTASNLSYDTGKINNAGDFTGATPSYFTLPTSTDFDVNPGTWNFWVKNNSTTGNPGDATAYGNVLLDHWDETTSSGAYAGLWITFGTDGTSKFRAGVCFSDGTTGSLTTNNVERGTSDTDRHMLTVVIEDSTTSAIYFDGDSTPIARKTNHESLNYSTNPVPYIGCVHREYGGSNLLGFDGMIDEISCWDTALSTAEIALLYNSGSGLAYDT